MRGIAGDADDPAIEILSGDPYLLVKCILPWPETLDQSLVDDDGLSVV